MTNARESWTWLIVSAVLFSTSRSNWYIILDDPKQKTSSSIQTSSSPWIDPGTWVIFDLSRNEYKPWYDFLPLNSLNPWNKKSIKILYCFAGKPRPGDLKDCLASFSTITAFSIHITELDIARSTQHDLLNPALQYALENQARLQEFNVIFMSPPCTTWSRARHRDPGPRPLRDITAPFGLPDLLPFEEQQVQAGTNLALWSLKLCAIQAAANGLFLLEHPEWLGKPRPTKTTRPGTPASIFLLPEAKSLIMKSGAISVALQQCYFGGLTAKPTRLLTNMYTLLEVPHVYNKLPSVTPDGHYNGPLSKCTHLHPTKIKEDDGSFASTNLQTYPTPLCMTIARCTIQFLIDQELPGSTQPQLDLSGNDSFFSL